jgi:hypothetical protein
MDVILDWATRIAHDMVARVSGPMKFRLILQPVMASIFAIRSGLADAKAGRRPYFWSLLTNAGRRDDLVKNGWKDVGRIFILAVLMDIAYQIIEQRWVYPFELLIVAFILAIVPYLILRGLVTRLARSK